MLNPSPFNATSIAAGVRTALDGTSARVSAVDTSLVRIELPEAERTESNAMRILSLVGNVRVAVENPARVIVDQASGVVLAGEGVLISPCVVGISEITIAIVEEDYAVQPQPLAAATPRASAAHASRRRRPAPTCNRSAVAVRRSRTCCRT